MPFYENFHMGNGADKRKVDISLHEFLATSGEFGFPATSRVLDLATSGTNGLDTGSVAPDTWYDCFWMWDNEITQLNTIACIMDNTPSLPADHDQYVRIGSVRTNAVAAPNCEIYRFHRIANWWWWLEDVGAAIFRSVDAVAASTSFSGAITAAMVPSHCETFLARLTHVHSAAGVRGMKLRAHGSSQDGWAMYAHEVKRIDQSVTVNLSSAQQFNWATADANGTAYVFTKAYYDEGD